jgi:HEAT repeat protein
MPISRLILHNLLSTILILCLTITLSNAQTESGSGSAVIDAYNSTDNSIEKRTILKSLSKDYEEGAAIPQWKVGLVKTGLAEKSPVVVEAAVKQAGKMVIKELTPQLITVFITADDRFMGGYPQRVRISLLYALGKTGGEGVAELFIHFLENDNGSALGEDVLMAIKELNDPVLISAVQSYAMKMETKVSVLKAKNSDPIQYSRYVSYITLAGEVEESLSNRKGDSK